MEQGAKQQNDGNTLFLKTHTSNRLTRPFINAMKEALDQAYIPRKGSVAQTATIMDIECLDQSLFRLMENALMSLVRDASSSTNHYAKLLALPCIQFFTILATNGQTPATQILKLELSSGTTDVSSRAARVTLFALLSSFLPTIIDPLVEWVDTKARNELEEHQIEHSGLARIAHERQRIVLTFIRKTVTRLVPAARLCCLLACWSGKTRTSSLAMLVSGLSFKAKGQEKPRLHVDYAHRRWLQHEATSTAKIFLAGLWMIASWKPVIDTYLVKPLALFAPRVSGSQSAAATSCPMCKSDINVPVLLSCRHKTCYTCFYADLDHGNRMSCRLCRKPTHESQAVLIAAS